MDHQHPLRNLHPSIYVIICISNLTLHHAWLAMLLSLEHIHKKVQPLRHLLVK